jgi:pSer/pThr/pTyr-binding forkhead associated (FHA) protein
MEIKLIVAEGKAKGREIPLPPTVFLIGRGKQCHLRPHCPDVSKLHCAIARWAGKVVVRDLKSANGTFVNDTRVEGEVRVRDGDTLRVGSLTFIFRVKDPGDDLMPVQVVHEGYVRWLLESPDDPSVPTAADTLTYERPDRFQDVPASANEPTVSAGEFLRDYFRKDKP